MPDDYLWDRTGEPDPDIQHLESLLAPYAYAVPASPHRLSRTRKRVALMAAAAAACLVFAAAGTLWLQHRKPLSEWQINGRRLAVGRVVETDGHSSTQLEADAFGQVELGPGSSLQVLPSAAGTQRLSLQRGTMHALIWAPPARFLVETPSAKTIDLGCSYTLSVAPDGIGDLTVQTGWVAFQNGAIESFIPAGAACRTRPRTGPGLPYFEDASAGLRNAVFQFDANSGRAGLTDLLASARPRDGLTLWHLLLRTSGPSREAVIQRFASLVPGADADALRAGDPKAIDDAWNRLGLGATDWWRLWKHGWQQQPQTPPQTPR